MKRMLVCLSVLTCACLIEAAEFKVRVLKRPDVVLLGTPGYVTVEMANISRGPVTVAYIANSGFRGSFVVRRADGKPRHGCREKGHEDSILAPIYKVLPVDGTPRLVCGVGGHEDSISAPIYKVLPADWRESKTEDVFSGCEDEPGEYVVQFVLSSNEAGGRISDGQGHVRVDQTLKAWTGEIRSQEIHIEIVKPTGEDKAAYNSYQACMKQITKTRTGSWEQCRDQLLSTHPASTYAGWPMKDWQPRLSGVFVKNEFAKRMIMAALRRNEEDMIIYWQFDVPLPESEKIRDRKIVMKNLVEASESFVGAHPDFLFSGWILARAGFNALGLGDFSSACVDLKRSLELGWELPGASKNAEPSYKEGVTYALELLKQHGYCKKD